jgi:hypothetical protein
LGRQEGRPSFFEKKEAKKLLFAGGMGTVREQTSS